MDISELDLEGGTFKLTLPYTTLGWIGWAIGLLVAIIGLVLSINDPLMLILIAIGCMVMAVLTPGSFEGSLNQVREAAIDPAELEAKAEASGLTIDSWWLQQTTYVPTNDPNDWILPAPGPAAWDEENRYGPHGDGTPLPEHPVNVGTPIPATFTLFSVFTFIINCFFYNS